MFHPPNVFRRKNNLFIVNTSLINSNSQNEVPKTKASSLLLEFCARSSIHGIVHLGDRTRTLIERVWWAIMITLAFSLYILWIYFEFCDSQKNLVVRRYDRIRKPINYVPFPVVKICPPIKSATKLFNNTEVHRSLLKFDSNRSRTITLDEIKIMKATNLICKTPKPHDDTRKLFVDDFLDDSILDTIGCMAPDFNETFVLCKLFEKWVDCSDILTPLITEHGKCYVFNSISLHEHYNDVIYFNTTSLPFVQPSSNWTLKDGYKLDNTDQKPYPHRVNGAGQYFGLTFILKVNDYNTDYTCNGRFQGFKVAFHTPCDFPHGIENEFELSVGMSAIYAITPKLIRTDDTARKYPPHVRKCYFNSERKLRFLKEYTQHNCEMECLANYTLAQCGCVHFAMLRANDTKVCGPKRTECLSRAGKSFYRSSSFIECNCLSSCVSLSYYAYPSSSVYDLASVYSKLTFHENSNLKSAKFSRLTVAFDDDSFSPTRRVESQNWMDYIASAGGLFSFCMGASLLSLVEILYYLTLRVFVAYCKSRKSSKVRLVVVLPSRAQY